MNPLQSLRGILPKADLQGICNLKSYNLKKTEAWPKLGTLPTVLEKNEQGVGRSLAGRSRAFLGKTQTFSLGDAASLFTNKIIGESLSSAEDPVCITFSSSRRAEPEQWACGAAGSSL